MGRTVLVVDDDTSILMGFQRGFTRAGLTVRTATTTFAASFLAKKHSPHLAVVDLRIGPDWGIALIRELKARYPEMRIVLVSGYLSVSSAVSAMHAGADDVVYKPITAGRIMQMLDEEAPDAPDPLPTLADMQREHVMRVLADCSGCISEAARVLGLHRQSLQRYLKRNAPAS
jgi:two-component system response regulator RegA